MSLQRKFDKEKCELVPERDYIVGHPLEDKIRKQAFVKKLTHKGSDPLLHFNGNMQTVMRTLVSSIYTNMYKCLRWTISSEMSGAQREQHMDWMFEELEKYQQEAKKLILKHFDEVNNSQSTK